jgi:glutamate-1-semialdehyde aminotransferase/acyl carrier protein
MGPGNTASILARQQVKDKKRQITIPSLGDTVVGWSECQTMLSAMGQLWLAGVDLDWENFYVNERRHRVALPTYPFARERFWVEPASRITEAENNGPAHESQDMEENNMLESQIGLARESRKQQLIYQLQDILEDVSGLNLAGVDESTTFFDMGLDSLLLTQVALTLTKTFNVKIKFRQLLEELTTFGLLAEFMDQELPPEPLASEPPPEDLALSPKSSSIPLASVKSEQSTTLKQAAPRVGAGTLEDVIIQQMQLMSRQLEMLRDNSSPAPEGSRLPKGEGIERRRKALSEEATTVNPGRADRKSPLKTNSSKKTFGAAARIETARGAALSPKQQALLDAFVERYTARTNRSKKFSQANRGYLADPRVVSGFRPIFKEIVYPIVANRSLGSKIWDIDGNTYVDLTCGFGSNFFGNSPTFVTEAIEAQIKRGIEIGPQTPLVGEVAKMICEFTGFDRAAFCNTGSEAVLGAMRLSRTVTGRNMIAIFSGSYHGILDEVIVRGSKKLKSIPAAPGIPASAVENVLVLEYGVPESLEILKDRCEELAAIMVEPVQSGRPDLQPKEFLHDLRTITEISGTALIFDEVITGFRVNLGGSQAHFGISADLASYGKVIGGGLPIGVIAGKSEFMDALDGGFWQFGDESFPETGVTYFAGTFVRHPLAIAAAEAVLRYLKDRGPDLQQKVNEKTEMLVKELNAHFDRVQAPIKLVNFGSLFKVTFTEEMAYGELLYYWLRDRGVHIWDARPCFLTTAHTDADLEFVMNAFKQSVAELQAGGFLSGSSNLEDSPWPGSGSSKGNSPVPGARLGRDPEGNLAWYMPDPERIGKYLQVGDQHSDEN